MKPRSSRATTPSSQSVRGEAPMKTKQASTSSTDSVPSFAAHAQALEALVLALCGHGRALRADDDVGQRRDLLDQVLATSSARARGPRTSIVTLAA